MEKKNLLDLTLTQLEELVDVLGEKKFRAKQLFEWGLKGVGFSDMTNLSTSLKEKLQEKLFFVACTIEKSLLARDGAEKLVMRLNDDNFIESVFLPNNYGNTICVSTQVGCKMGCVFCSSGKNGLVRNLTAAEIVGQYIAITNNISNNKANKTICGGEGLNRGASNIVFMGSGEPLENYVEALRAIKLFTDKNAFNKSGRNISVSTCGIVDKILLLAQEGLQITLSLSLHATTDAVRKTLMPIARTYSIKETMAALKHYFTKTKRRVCVEYTLIDGVNDFNDDAIRLADLCGGFACHINLIPLNPSSRSRLRPSKRVNEFLSILEKQNASATIRRSYGKEIDGACGQLIASKIQG